MKKKLLTLTLAGLITLSIASCGRPEKASDESNKKDAQIESLQAENTDLKKQLVELQKVLKEQEPKKPEAKDFNIKDLSFNFSILPSSKWVQISGTYVNNSPYTITNIIITFTDSATNTIKYWGSYETVLPGETSPKSEGDSIDNMDTKMENMKPNKYSIDAKTPDGKNIRITYDAKLDEYDISNNN